MNIGEKIRQLRKWRGMSQEKLGEALNMTAQNVSSLELGRTKPSPEILRIEWHTRRHTKKGPGAEAPRPGGNASIPYT